VWASEQIYSFMNGCFSAEISFLVQAISTQGPVGWGFRGCEASRMKFSNKCCADAWSVLSPIRG